MKRMRRAAALLALALLASAGPARAQGGFTLMSPEQERQLGQQEHPKILQEFGGVYDDPEVGGWIAEIGGRIAAASGSPPTQYTFTVLDSPIVNAMALPGGYVYLTRGLLALANTEAEVAGVLAHEIGHVVARHTARRHTSSVLANIGAGLLGILTGSEGAAQLGQFVGAGVLAQYSQGQEFESDSLGVRFMAEVGYNPRAQADFLSSLNREHDLQESVRGGQGNPLEGFFATHPNTLERVQRAAAAAAETGAPPNAFYGRDELLRRIDGMPYGDSAAQGFVKGRTFAHPKLRLQFTVPEDFRIVNQPQAVMAQGPGGAIVRFDNAPMSNRSDPLDYLANEWGAKAALRNVERIEVNGAPGATARTRVQTKEGARDARLVAVRFPEGAIYRFVFLTPPSLTARLAEELQRTTYSLRRLSEQEAAALKGLHIRVVEVRPGDSVETLAQRMVVESRPVDRFRVLNALEPEMALRPGEKVKIIAP
jgi:predicted Zn-dependent protease